MPQKKSTDSKSYRDETILDSILWFIENYLPQKKKRKSNAELGIEKFETFTIEKLKKWTSVRSKSLSGDLSNTKITFTVGHWALPYLKFFRRIKLLK
tara:strand:+ start:300 stop:590 length:291 start_codon:yes stop_codon:yes gene_type:complete